MPRGDAVALLKLLLAKEVTDAPDNEVLDEILALRDPLLPADGVNVAETSDFRLVLGAQDLGFCELSDQLAVIDSQADWQAGTIPDEADGTTTAGAVKLARKNKVSNPDFSQGLTGWTWYTDPGNEGTFVNEGPTGGPCLKFTVDKTNTSKDVVGVSRVLTGWSDPPKTILVRGKSKGVFTAKPAGRDVSNWSVYFDVVYKDGSTFEKYQALQYGNGSPAWDPNYSDWQEATVRWTPPKPIQHLTCLILCRNVFTGTVWFTELMVAEVDGDEATAEISPYSPYYWEKASIITKELDLGADPLIRPVMLFPVLDDDSPATGSAQVTKYRTRASQVDAWGPWTDAVQLDSGGALTAGPPQRYLEMEIELATTDTTQTPVLVKAGVYD